MILVTGGTGMIGSRLIADLLQDGYAVKALKRPLSDTALLDYHLANDSTLFGRIEWVEGDLLDIDTLEKALEGVQTVFHTAGLVSFLPGHEDALLDSNMKGTANLVNLCLENDNIRYFAYVSSVATLGRSSGQLIIDEDCHWNPGTPQSPYAVSKYTAEREVWRAMAEGLNAVIVNPSIVLGPGPKGNGSSTLFRKVLQGFPFHTLGVSGFVDVRDVSDALRWLFRKGIAGERFILNSENMSFRDLFIRMATAFGVKAPPFLVRPWMSSLIWPIEKIRSTLTRSSPFITKETARSAQSEYRYSSEKIRKLGFRFRTIDECIGESVPFFKKEAITG
jgi:nucleoside-diphosphate-sugar epimerase